MHGAPRAPRDKRYSTNLWRRVREQVRDRDRGICQACGRKQPLTGRRLFPVDHRNPNGDFYDPENLWLLCWSCNTSKSVATVEEWHARARRLDVPPSSESVPFGLSRRRSGRYTFAYHRHQWGPAIWQVQLVGYMRRGAPRLDGCPADCTVPKLAASD